MRPALLEGCFGQPGFGHRMCGGKTGMEVPIFHGSESRIEKNLKNLKIVVDNWKKWCYIK